MSAEASPVSLPHSSTVMLTSLRHAIKPDCYRSQLVVRSASVGQGCGFRGYARTMWLDHTPSTVQMGLTTVALTTAIGDTTTAFLLEELCGLDAAASPDGGMPATTATAEEAAAQPGHGGQQTVNDVPAQTDGSCGAQSAPVRPCRQRHQHFWRDRCACVGVGLRHLLSVRPSWTREDPCGVCEGNHYPEEARLHVLCRQIFSTRTSVPKQSISEGSSRCSRSLSGAERASRCIRSDRLPASERGYARCADLAAALARGTPVQHSQTIGARQRTAAWTVLVSPRGVAEYLNKRISPLGASHASSSVTGAGYAFT